MPPHPTVSAGSESDRDTSWYGQTPSTSNANTHAKPTTAPASSHARIADIKRNILNTKNALTRRTMRAAYKGDLETKLQDLKVQLGEAQAKSAGAIFRMDHANTPAEEDDRRRLYDFLREGGLAKRDKEAFAEMSGAAARSHRSDASIGSWSIEDHVPQLEHTDKEFAAYLARDLRSVMQTQGGEVSKSPTSNRAALTSLITQEHTAKPTEHNSRHMDDSEAMLETNPPHPDPFKTVRHRRAAQRLQEWNGPPAAMQASRVPTSLSEIQVCTRDRCYCAKQNTCPWLIGERHAQAQIQSCQPRLSHAWCDQPVPDNSVQEFMRILMGGKGHVPITHHDRSEVVGIESADHSAMSLPTALDVLALNDTSRLTPRGLKDKFTSLVANADGLDPEIATLLAQAFKTISMHLDDNDGWYDGVIWTSEMDESLLALKTNHPTMFWFDIAAELNINANECKKRFATIKPNGWKPNLAKAKSSHKKAVKSKKYKNAAANTKEGGSKTKGIFEDGDQPLKGDRYLDGDRFEDGGCFGGGGFLETATQDKPDPWDHSVFGTPRNGDNAWVATVPTRLGPVTWGWSEDEKPDRRANPVDDTAQNGTDVCGTAAPERVEPATWGCFEDDAESMGGAWGNNNTRGGDASGWTNVDTAEGLWETGSKRDDTPALSKAATPDEYKVTYWATIESGDQIVHIPIDAHNVSGSEKAIVENDKGMKKVWKWAQEKGLTDKVGLQDVFDLAKSMHHREPDEDLSNTADKKDAPGNDWGFQPVHGDTISSPMPVNCGWETGTVKSPCESCCALTAD